MAWGRRSFYKWMLQLTLIAALVVGSAGQAAAADEIARLVLNKNEVTMSVGDTYSLTATALYVSGSTADATIKTEWSSDTVSVATVYAGTVAGKTEGSALIKATYMGKTEFVHVTVIKKVRSLTKSKQELSLRVGEEEQLGLTAVYADNTFAEVASEAEWTTESDSVATVMSGKVTAVGAGETNIHAAYGGKTVTFPISVDKVRRLDMDPQKLDLRIGAQSSVSVMAMFENGVTEDVADKAVWTTDNAGIADAFKGVITAYGSGTTTIRASYGGQTAAIKVQAETVRKLEVDSSDLFLKPDQSKQLTLTATYADGTTADVADKAVWTSSDDGVADAEQGEVTANAVGQAEITASYGGKSVKVLADVGVARKLEADVSSLMLRRNESATIKLMATYADQTTENVATSADWFSDDESVAYVSKGVLRALGKGEALITAAYGDKQVTIPVSVDTTQSLKADAGKLELKLAESKQVALTVTYADGTTEQVTDLAEWDSEDSSIAAVYQGRVTAVSSGQTEIVAQYGERSVTIPVYVEMVRKLAPSKTDVFLKVNGTEALTLTATYAGGETADVTAEANWDSDNDQVVGVDKGKLIAYSSGQATITVSYGSKSSAITVDVSVARKLTADARTLSLRRGDDRQIELSAVYADGTSEQVTDRAEWSSDNQGVAVVHQGRIKAIGSGSANVTARYGGQAVEVLVEVDPAVKLTASQTKFDVQPGDMVQVRLEAQFADNTTGDVTEKAVWASSNDSFATVRDGVIVAIDRGEATITGTYGKRSVKIKVSIGALEAITLSERTLVMKEDERKQLVATARYKDGTVKDVTAEAEWSSSASSVAEVWGGTVTALESGRATITARFGEKSVSAVAQVELAAKLSASHRSVILRKGQIAQIALTATYADGTTEDVTPKAAWSVTAAKVADVSEGLVTAYERGKTTLVAKYGSKSLSIPLEVDYPVKLSLSERSLQLKSGAAQLLTLTATFSDGSTQDVSDEAEWTTRSFKVADVSANGEVSAVGYGKTSVTAKFGGKSVSAAVEVDGLKYLKSSVKTVELSVGQKKLVPLTATYKDGSTGDVTARAEWRSAREQTADVMDGEITGYAKGTTTVKAKFAGKTVTIKVIVK